MREKQPEVRAANLVLLPGFGEEREVSVAEELLRQRVEALEERLEQMRLSRRVLMRILERAEQDRQVEIANLRRENERLHQQNRRLARSAWQARIR